jgi:hypothetical protein
MIFGLSFATVSTLVIVPALLTLKFRFKDWLAARKRKRNGGNGHGKLKAGEVEAAVEAALAGTIQK